MTNRSNRYGETFRTRAFFPSYDLPEDQVCGTAHTLIGPYWATQQPDLVNTLLESNQVSPRRGRIGVRWDGEWAVGTCQLFGTGRSEPFLRRSTWDNCADSLTSLAQSLCPREAIRVKIEGNRGRRERGES